MKEFQNKVEKHGYVLGQYSNWSGDNGKFWLTTRNDTTIGIINTNNNTISPTHGYYGGYLKSIAKKLGLELINDN